MEPSEIFYGESEGVSERERAGEGTNTPEFLLGDSLFEQKLADNDFIVRYRLNSRPSFCSFVNGADIKLHFTSRLRFIAGVMMLADLGLIQ